MVASGDFLKVTAIGSLASASNPIINTFHWRVIAVEGIVSLQEAGPEMTLQFVSRYYAPLQGILSNQFALTEVKWRNYADEDEGYDGGGDDFVGTATGAIMPPFVTYSIRKTRRFFNIRNGRWAYPGVPVSVGTSDGRPNNTVRNDVALWGSGIVDEHWAIELDVGGITLQDVILREPATPGSNPTVFSPISGISLNSRFGSQNSRK